MALEVASAPRETQVIHKRRLNVSVFNSRGPTAVREIRTTAGPGQCDGWPEGLIEEGDEGASPRIPSWIRTAALSRHSPSLTTQPPASSVIRDRVKNKSHRYQLKNQI